MKRTVLAWLACVLALVPALQAQTTTYFSENFESVAVGLLPAGWGIYGSEPGFDAAVAANSVAFGINTSSQILSLSPGSNKNLVTGGLDMAAAQSAGDTFTLSFDLYADSTTGHGFILGFGGETAQGASQWLYTSTAFGFGVHYFDLAAANTWEHFSLDVTDGVAAGNALHLQSGAGIVYLDNIVLTSTSAIPEPATYAGLFGLAALGLAGLGSRRRRSFV